MTPQADMPVEVPLTDDERHLLQRGLHEWLGPARPSDALAQLLGLDGAAGFTGHCKELYAALETGRPLLPTHWAFALVATEIAYTSDLLGSGVDWMTTTGIRDAETVAILRPLQRKLRRAVPGLRLADRAGGSAGA